MEKDDNGKFYFKDLIKNTNGKASGSGFIGVIIGCVGALSFIATMIGYFLKIEKTLEVQDNIIMLLGISALLLGIRKAAGGWGKRPKLYENDIDNGKNKKDN